MIFTTIISWVTGVISIILSILPDVDPTTIAQISYYTNTFRTLMSNINWFFPVNTALLFLSLIFAIQLSLFLFKVIKYISGVLTAGILK